MGPTTPLAQSNSKKISIYTMDPTV